MNKIIPLFYLKTLALQNGYYLLQQRTKIIEDVYRKLLIKRGKYNFVKEVIWVLEYFIKAEVFMQGVEEKNTDLLKRDQDKEAEERCNSDFNVNLNNPNDHDDDEIDMD